MLIVYIFGDYFPEKALLMYRGGVIFLISYFWQSSRTRMTDSFTGKYSVIHLQPLCYSSKPKLLMRKLSGIRLLSFLIVYIADYKISFLIYIACISR